MDTLAIAMVSKARLHGLHQFDRIRHGVAGESCTAALSHPRAQQHLLAAAAAGQQADASFDQAHVKLGMRLARGSVQRDLRAAAQAQAERRDHHRLGRELDGLRHALELADGEIDVVPLFFLHAHEQQHQIGADGEIRRRRW